MSMKSSRYRSASVRARASSSEYSSGFGNRLADAVVAIVELRPHDRGQLEQRQVQRQHDGRDDDAHEDQHRRLDQLGDPLHFGLDLFVIELGEAAQHVLKRPGGLPNLDHLDRDVRKDRTGPEGAREALPFLDAPPYLVQAIAHVSVRSGPNSNVQRMDERDAAAQQGRDHPGDLGGEELTGSFPRPGYV